MTKPKYSNDSLLAPKVAPTRSWPAAYLAACWNIWLPIASRPAINGPFNSGEKKCWNAIL